MTDKASGLERLQHLDHIAGSDDPIDHSGLRFQSAHQPPHDPDTFGVSLEGIRIALVAGGMTVSREPFGLVARQGAVTVRIKVEQPEDRNGENGTIRAVLTVRAELPQDLSALFRQPGGCASVNRFAVLGALDVAEGKPCLGSRITLYEEESAWNIQAPLILAAALASPQIMLDAIRHLLLGDGAAGALEMSSAWGEAEFSMARQYLSRIAFCNADRTGLTAEFALREGEVAAVAGHRHTALWRLLADQPHPEAGAGLFCCLEMPHCADDEEELARVLAKLNAMEMQALDRPPHFGAWCPGTYGTNPAYVSFLPNFLHDVRGIAVNLSFWAYGRAQWADAMLPTLGITA